MVSVSQAVLWAALGVTVVMIGLTIRCCSLSAASRLKRKAWRRGRPSVGSTPPSVVSTAQKIRRSQGRQSLADELAKVLSDVLQQQDRLSAVSAKVSGQHVPLARSGAVSSRSEIYRALVGKRHEHNEFHAFDRTLVTPCGLVLRWGVALMAPGSRAHRIHWTPLGRLHLSRRSPATGTPGTPGIRLRLGAILCR